MAKAKKYAKSDSAAGMTAVAVQLGFVLVAAVLVYSFVSVTRDGEMRRRCVAPCLLRPDYMGADRIAPEFTLSDLKGQKVSLWDYRGKVVVMNFWSSSCRPCLEEMPEIADLARILADRRDVAVLAVSIDDDASQDLAILKSVLGTDPPFTSLVDPDSTIIGPKYGTHLFPETWFIDKRGVIRARFDGGRQWSNSAVVEYVDDLRKDGYCPVDVKVVNDAATHRPVHRAVPDDSSKAFDVAAAKLCTDQAGEALE
jgi:peroxiredoxin